MSRKLLLGCMPLVLAAALGSPAALALEAGITIDVHQDIYPQQFWPNDFHVQGLICSHDGAPVLVEHIDDVFTNFTYTIQPLATGEECWYWFEATWVWPGHYIPYCTVIHLGLLFDVNASNIVVDLTGWWTRNGQPVGNLYGNLRNRGYAPVIGFNVADMGSPQVVTLGNGNLTITPEPPAPLPPAPPMPPTLFDLQLMQVDVIPFPPGAAPPLAALKEGGAQQTWPWVPVAYADGQPISPGRPLIMAPDSFFDIFLEIGARAGLRPVTPFTIQPGGFLAVRQLVQFTNNDGLVEQRWSWEIHGSQPNEACCFADGHCEDIQPFTCVQRGGTPKGAGSICTANLCLPQGKGACCLSSIAGGCAVTTQLNCEQLGGVYKGDGTTCDDLNGNGVADICEAAIVGACCYGQIAPLCVVTTEALCNTQYPNGVWKGPGTTCDDLDGDGVADICEPPVGACCYGLIAPLCVVTTEALCTTQYPNGVWKGPGTTCDDLDGDGVADICEPPALPEACCLPTGACVMVPATDCLAMGGQPKGPYSMCLGDSNGNGVDDVCDLKWLQPPDLGTTGIDVADTQPLVLADDFVCRERGLLTDFVIWGSWYHDITPQGANNVVFTLSLHADIPDPDGNGPLFGMPGPVLWMHTFQPGTFQTALYGGNLQEGFWDPRDSASFEFPGDTMCFQYTFHLAPDDAFCQQGSAAQPIVYWLDVQAQALGTTQARFGWKTSLQHQGSRAVWGQGVEPYPGPWNELRYPPQHPLNPKGIDLAFSVNGDLRCVCVGDMNCDGKIDFADINPFVLRLTNPAAYKLAYPLCPNANGDINKDGAVNFGDINPFVALLTSQPLPIRCQ
jgi:hypothetical protein